nr:hypothetical protein [uncultured Flavobacterium sp.]
MVNLYYTHIDLLSIAFSATDLISHHNPFFLVEQTNNILFEEDKFTYHYLIKYKITSTSEYKVIARAHLIKKLDKSFNVIQFTNEILYNIYFQDIIDKLLCTYKFENIRVNTLDIAIDTSEILTLKFNKQYNNGKLKFDPKYKSYYFGDQEFRRMYGYKGAIKNETFYIKTEKDRYDPNSRNRKMRIEHKTNEIALSSHKDYIYSFLSDKLDISKAIYRIELSLKNYNSFYDTNKKRSILFDFSRVTDATYLTSVFNYFSTFSHELILDTHKNVPKFLPTYYKSPPKAKKVNTRYTFIMDNLNKLQMQEHLQAIINEAKSQIEYLNNNQYSPLTSDGINEVFDDLVQSKLKSKK